MTEHKIKNDENLNLPNEYSVDLVGQALYTINKEAKRYRDLKSELYIGLKKNHWDNKIISEIIKENNSLILDCNPNCFIICDYFDRSLDIFSDDLENQEEEARNNIYIYEYDIENMEELLKSETEDEKESLIERLEDLKDSLKLEKDILSSIAELKEKRNNQISYIKNFMDFLEIEKENLYRLKNNVLKKINPEIQMYHEFTKGDIRPLYRIGKFTFHGDAVENLPDDVLCSELQILNEISSENELDIKMDVNEAKKILSNLLQISY